MFSLPKVLLMILIFFLSATGFASDRKVVLVMHSYHQGLEWTDEITGAILETFHADGGDYEIFFEYLDTKRNPGEEYFARLSDFEKQKKQLAGLDFDVIIASDNDALRFLTGEGRDLFAGIPVVFCGLNNYTPQLLGGRSDITGITESIDYRSTLEIMKKLHGNRDKVLIIVDRTSTGNALTEELKNIEREFSGSFTFQYMRDFSVESIGEEIAALGKEYIIYLLVMNSDRNGVFISYSDAIKLVRQAAAVPIYGSWDFFFGKGIVGGMIVSGYDQGEAAAQMALRILKGEDPSDIPVVTMGANRYMFDYREIVRFGISRSLLPENSFVINEPPPLYKKYHTPLIVIISIGGSLLFLFFLFNGYQKKKTRDLEGMNRLLDRRVEEALSEVKTLSGLLPVCARCKKIRDDSGYWEQLDSYVKKHTDVDFTHGLCPDCAAELYPKHFPPEKDGKGK